MNETSEPVVVDEQTAKENAVNLKKLYRQHPELNVAPLTGRSKRKLIRQNTVHLRAICPNCGKDNIKFRKIVHSKPRKYNVWYCSGCEKTFKRGDLEYVKYA